MVNHPQQERIDDAAENESTQSRAQLLRQKLMIVAHYALLGFTPLLATVALVFALLAFNANRADQTRFGELSAKLESANTSLAAAKSEMENLKMTLARQRAQLEGQQGQQQAMLAEIVPAVTRLQVKLKMSPTLEEQLHQSAPAVAPVAPAPVISAAPVAPAPVAPAAPEKKPLPQMHDLKEAIDKFNKK